MMISNQSQIQPNFQGNLLKEGLKLPQKKFNEVAKIYAKKTQEMPDLKLIGRLNNSDFDGQFYHSVHAILNGEDIASIVTKSFKNIFKENSPKEMAKELVNITRRYVAKEKASQLVKEADDLGGKIKTLKIQMKHISDPIARNRLQVLSDRMEATFCKKQEQLNELLTGLDDFSAEWCV